MTKSTCKHKQISGFFRIFTTPQSGASLVALTLSLSACKTTGSMESPFTGFYGEDDRKDIYEASLNPKERELANAVAVRVKASGTQTLPDRSIDLKPTPLKALYKTCDGERFENQPLVGGCTGFLIGPDLLATAGHCVKSDEICKQYLWVFGYMLDTKDKDVSRSKPWDVYQCSKIERISLRKPGTDYLDYAVIRLDRPVTGRAPIPLTGTDARVGHKVKMIGHPLGMPMKVTGDDKSIIRTTESDRAGHIFWSTNLDGFTGNSGSPVFREEDQSLVGIFVYGDKDFDESLGCRESIKRSDEEGLGERVVPVKYLN
jgi:V8-like Glu-specific endopeptidase